MVRAFYNIPIFDEHVYKTAVISPCGLHEYLRMPLGLRNAPSSFQRFIKSIVGDLPFVFCYIDDLLIFSRTEEEHYEHLATVFARLAKCGLTINLSKCQFVSDKVKFLGYTITKDGFSPSEQRVEIFKKLKLPATITELRRTLGSFTFYRNFCRKAAELLAPLHEILQGHPRKNDRTPIRWTEPQKQAFEASRQAFINYTMLHYPQESAQLMLTTDASSTAVGGVLEQLTEDGERQPLGFFSHKLAAA